MITKKTKKTNLLATCAITALLPVLSHATQGVYIVEPFSCDVLLADKKELLRSTKEDNPQFVQMQLEISLVSVLDKLVEYSECEVK